MSATFTDQAVIVTGSSSGIGRAIAKTFAAEGAQVVTNSRSYERAEKTAEEIRRAGGRAVPVEADMSDYDDVQALVGATIEEFGGVDVLVNNAGHTIIDEAEDLSPEDWQSVIDVNLTGVFYGAQAAGRHMIDSDEGGSIVNVSSMLGEMGLQMRAPYCASKAGVNNLTRTLAVEWAEHDVRVNALAPGYIETSITEEVQGQIELTDEDIRNRTPLRRWGTVEEMANCALFLARRDTFVTGEILRADGGYTAFAWGSWE